jgi:apolipoprotein D and lipocalin family protein
MTLRKLIYLGLVQVGACSVVRAAGGGSPLETVPKVDLNRYVGRWYEIAKYPNRFERKCDSNVTATYGIRPDGKISVVNSFARLTKAMSPDRAAGPRLLTRKLAQSSR